VIKEEEKLLIDILFEKKDINLHEIKKVNLEKLTKICSSHLSIPVFYSKCRKKKILQFFPSDFNDYLEEIFQINLERNKILINEILFISKLLNKNSIDHVFIKGSSHIIQEIYDNIGERMVGDIDILVRSVSINKCKEILIQEGFEEINDGSFKKHKISNKRHIKRLIKKSSLFCVEIHSRITNNKIKGLCVNEILNDKIKERNVSIPKLKDQIDINIYNYQLNDKGSLRLSYSFRSFYDFWLLSKRNKFIFSNLDSHKKKFLLMYNLLKIEKINKISLNNQNLNKLRFILKKKMKIFFLIDNGIISLLSYLINKMEQIIEFLINKEFRIHVLKKLK